MGRNITPPFHNNLVLKVLWSWQSLKESIAATIRLIWSMYMESGYQTCWIWILIFHQSRHILVCGLLKASKYKILINFLLIVNGNLNDFTSNLRKIQRHIMASMRANTLSYTWCSNFFMKQIKAFIIYCMQANVFFTVFCHS